MAILLKLYLGHTLGTDRRALIPKLEQQTKSPWSSTIEPILVTPSAMMLQSNTVKADSLEQDLSIVVSLLVFQVHTSAEANKAVARFTNVRQRGFGTANPVYGAGNRPFSTTTAIATVRKPTTPNSAR